MLSTHELGNVTGVLPSRRGGQRSHPAARMLPASAAPGRPVGTHAPSARYRLRRTIVYTGAFLYGFPFYTVCCLAIARANLRRRQQIARAHAARASIRADRAGGMDQEMPVQR